MQAEKLLVNPAIGHATRSEPWGQR